MQGTLDILQGSNNGDLTLPKSLERCEVGTNAPLFQHIKQCGMCQSNKESISQLQFESFCDKLTLGRLKMEILHKLIALQQRQGKEKESVFESQTESRGREICSRTYKIPGRR